MSDKPNKDLRLNSLSRYAKETSKLVLEEHGHCEIPAGCGGVVLRWFNPSQSMPLEFWVYVDGEVKFALDGHALKSARPLVNYGEHVLAFVVSGFKVTTGILMFAALSEIKSVTPSDEPARKVIVSDADGSWKYTLDTPHDDSWMQAGFDDEGWQTLVLKPLAEPAVNASYPHQKLVEIGANGLGIDTGETKVFGADTSPAQIWIRKVFHLTS